MRKPQYNIQCNIAQTLNIIGDKWSLLILHRLLIGYETYKEIFDGLEGIPTNLLSGRLKTLEHDELLYKELYQDHPPRYKYSLTEKGMDLVDVFNSLVLWGEKHLTKCHKKLVHNQCHHTVELKYYCPQCNVYVDSNNLEVIEPNE